MLNTYYYNNNLGAPMGNNNAGSGYNVKIQRHEAAQREEFLFLQDVVACVGRIAGELILFIGKIVNAV